jgi:hypothetical protein
MLKLHRKKMSFLDDVCGGFFGEAAAHLPGLGRRLWRISDPRGHT